MSTRKARPQEDIPILPGEMDAGVPSPEPAVTGFPMVDRVIETARKEARKEVGRILRDLAKAVEEPK